MAARDAEQELVFIKSVDQVIIDHSLVLAVKRGDLSALQGEVFKCTPSAAHLQGVPLVLKRTDCIDRRIYD
jgi:serine/threonine protein kinase